MTRSAVLEHNSSRIREMTVTGSVREGRPAASSGVIPLPHINEKALVRLSARFRIPVPLRPPLPSPNFARESSNLILRGVGRFLYIELQTEIF